MANMILVDYDTALHPTTRAATKEAVIEAVVQQPDTLIAVLNANHTMTVKESEQNLHEAQFPFDTVMCNPLPSRVDNLTYKTMFAAKIQEQQEHKVTLVVDGDREAAQMWSDAFSHNDVGVVSVGG